MVEADVIISAATMKTHLLTNVTLAMKNMYGCFPEENKAKFHRFGIENVVFEVNKAFTPNLAIIDGSIGGEAFGPLSSKPVNFETIIASNDVVAADSVACRLIGYDPLQVKHVKMAHDASLGDANLTFDTSTLARPISLKRGRRSRHRGLPTHRVRPPSSQTCENGSRCKFRRCQLDLRHLNPSSPDLPQTRSPQPPPGPADS